MTVHGTPFGTGNYIGYRLRYAQNIGGAKWDMKAQYK